MTVIPSASLANVNQGRALNLLQAIPIQNIPGIGPVQVIPASALQAQQQTQQTIQALPINAQILRKFLINLNVGHY